MTRMIETPVSASPAMIARSTGAAPRQRGSSDGWTLSISKSLQQGLLDERAERAHDDDVGLGRGDPRAGLGPVDVLGLVEVDAEALGDARDRRCGQRRPRPAGRSGRVTTSTGRCGVRARRSRTLAAKPDVPR